MLIGIDPGCSGAIVATNDSGTTVLWWSLMPTLKVGKSTRINGAALGDSLRGLCSDQIHGPAHAYLEQVHAMPKQGVTSVFTFGHAAGVAEGLLQGLGIPYTLVPPQTWKKRAGLIGQDKDAARSRAIQLWPHWRTLDVKGKGQALADAALIARYGSEAVTGQHQLMAGMA